MPDDNRDDNIDIATRPGRPGDAKDPPAPAWQRRLLHATVAVSAGWLILLGAELACIAQGGQRLDAIVHYFATAASAVLWVSWLAAVAVRRTALDVARVVRADVARVEAKMDVLLQVWPQLPDAIGECLDRRYLAGSQEALDAVGGNPDRVVPLNPRQTPGGRRTS